jgi:hypothetical protein
VSATISIGVGHYGILQGGVFRRKVVGTYLYNNGYCKVSEKQTITVKLPRTVDGYDSTENSTGTVPWDQG